MKKINFLTILFAFLGISSNAFAAWEGSGEGTLVDGVWYVVYQNDYETLNTIETGPTIDLLGPGARLSYEAKGSSSLTGAGVKYFNYSFRLNGSSDWKDVSQSLTTGYVGYGADLSTDVNAIRFLTKTGSTYTKNVRNIRVTMAQYVEAPSKSSVAFGSAKVNAADASSTFTIAWCNVPAMTYEITGEDKGQFSVSVANNAAAGKYNTATFTVKYKHDKVGEHTATLTVKDTYGNYNKSISLSGTTVKNNNAITWNAAEGWKDWDETLTLSATSDNTDEGAVINFESSNTEYASIADGVVTFHEAGAGKSVKITATQAESDHFYAANSVVKTFNIKYQQVLAWDAEVVNPNMAVGAERDITGYAVPQLETTVPVVYSSANSAIISVDGNTLTANAIGNVEITASIAADEQHRAAEISKTFVVKEKESAVVKQGDAIIEQNGVLTLHLGEESGVIASSNTEKALQVLIADESIARYNKETKKIEPVAVGQTTLTLSQEASTEYLPYANEVTLKVELVENTLAVVATEITKYVDEELVDFIIAGNSDAAISVESSDPTIAYYDEENAKVVIPNSEAKSFKETVVTLTVSQEATALIGAAEKKIALTVKKYENVIKVNGQTNYAVTLAPAHSLAIAFVANNPAAMDSIAQESGEKNATLVDGNVEANYIPGTAKWSVFQFETYKYQAAKATFSVKVERQAEATDCYVLNEPNEQKESKTFDLSGKGAVLSVEVRRSWGDVSASCSIYGISPSGAETLIESPSWDDNYKKVTADISSADYTKIKITLSGGVNTKYFKNLTVTRASYLNAGAAEFNVLPTEVGEATIKVDYNLSNGGDLKIVSDKDYFSFEPSVIKNVDCKNGSATVKVRFTAPEEEGDHLANITIFNGVYTATAQVVGHVKKVTPTITWADFAIPFGENAALNATCSPANEILYELVDPETNVLHIEDGKIYADNAGTAKVKAYTENSVKYNEAEKVISVTVNQAPQTIEWTQELPELKAGDEPFQLVAVASSGLDVTFETSDPAIAYVDAENKLHAVASGEVTITAKQAGTNNIAAVESAPRAMTIQAAVIIDPVDPGDTRKKQQIYWDFGSGYEEGEEIDLKDYEGESIYIYAEARDANNNYLGLEFELVSMDSTIAYADNAGDGEFYFYPLAVGTVVITAIQPGNAEYQPVASSKTFVIVDSREPANPSTGCENVEAGEKAVKIFRDGQIFILRGEKVYTPSGLLVK